MSPNLKFPMLDPIELPDWQLNNIIHFDNLFLAIAFGLLVSVWSVHSRGKISSMISLPISNNKLKIFKLI